jgi:hypothetical protein
LRFGDPETADIVIFDGIGSQFIRRALNPRHSVAVFQAHPSELRIGARTIARFFRQLAGIGMKDVDRSRGPLRGVAKEVWLVYLKSMIMAMRPKAVVTFIDNSGDFHWLSRHCRAFPLIAIQNGSRLRYAAGDGLGYYVQHLFCFGAHETKLFPQLGYQVEHFHPVGSLVASLHFDPGLSNVAEEYDLLVVSTWRGNIGFPRDVSDTMRSMKIMDELLAEYIRSRGIKAAVILRAERDSEHWVMPEMGASEEQYYRGVYGDCIEIVETDFGKRNVFPLMQRSRVIVSCLSTALLEALGIGKKILYCNFIGTDLYHADLPPLIATSDSDRASFFRRLDELRDMSPAEYLRLSEEWGTYFMSNPGDQLTHQSIAAEIDRLIEASQRHPNG